MQYTQLGRTGAKVSRLALGTMNFGWHTDEQASQTIMDAALDAGVNFFDTADIYGAGASESILGRWFADEPSRRDKVVLATKLYIPLTEGPIPVGCRRCTSARRARTVSAGSGPTTSTCTSSTTSTGPPRGRRSGRRPSGWSGTAR